MPKAEIHMAIEDDKYMRTRQSISQSATGTTISDDVNWSLDIYLRAIAQQAFRVDFISALLANYDEFFLCRKDVFQE